MSRLEVLIKQWRLELDRLQNNVRVGQATDAWRWLPMIKVLNFLLASYGTKDESIGLESDKWRASRACLLILAILLSFAGVSYLSSWSGPWDRLNERFWDNEADSPKPPSVQLLHAFGFTRPWLLLLLILVPLALVIVRRWSADLDRRGRGIAQVSLTSAALVLLLSAAGVRILAHSKVLTVIFVLDHSASVPLALREQAIDFLDSAIRTQRQTGDRVGAVIFGRDAMIEYLPTDKPMRLAASPENAVDSRHTDLAGAINRAARSFTEDSAKRIVIVSDGNQNRGDALASARAAAQVGIGFDVIPILYRHVKETIIDDLILPPRANAGEPLTCEALLFSTAPTTGILRITQRADKYSGLVAEKRVELERGTTRITAPLLFTSPGVHWIEATFKPAEPNHDQIAGNNRIQSRVIVQGFPRVLLVEGVAGEHDRLVSALDAQGISVTRATADRLPMNLAELEIYDCVILANGPPARDDSDRIITEEMFGRLSGSQMELLGAITHDFGVGLIMIGGPHSFGAGGYAGTPLEQASPVNMVGFSSGDGAVVVIADRLAVQQDELWLKQIVKETVKTLGYRDQAGCIVGSSWLFRLEEVKDKSRMLALADRMNAVSITSFDSVLSDAWDALRQSKARTKHILLATARSEVGLSPPVMKKLTDAKITVTALYVGGQNNDLVAQRTLANLARHTGGRFYNFVQPTTLPKIVRRAAFVAPHSPVLERENGWSINVAARSNLIKGLAETTFPVITGLALTTAKEDPGVEVVLVSPARKDVEPPLLAAWTYGLGRSVAFTSDAGRKWASAWQDWEHYDTFWTQVVRWAMRDSNDDRFELAARRENGRLAIELTVNGGTNQQIDTGSIRGHMVTPDQNLYAIEFTSVSAGRYRAEIAEGDTPGVYLVIAVVKPSKTESVVLKRAAVTVPYSAEYRDLEPNNELLGSLAAIVPNGGKSGSILSPALPPARIAESKQASIFRHDLPRPVLALNPGPWLVLAGGCLMMIALACTRSVPPGCHEDLQYENTVRHEEITSIGIPPFRPNS